MKTIFLHLSIFLLLFGFQPMQSQNSLDVCGWLQISGDQNFAGDANPGTIRWNSLNTCAEIYNGLNWSCLVDNSVIQTLSAGNDIDIVSNTIRIEPELDFVHTINSPLNALEGNVSGNTIRAFSISPMITKFGYNACPNLDSRNHVMIGDEAGFNISSIPISSQNLVFVGFRAGYNMTAGSSNTFIGHQAGHGFVSGTANVSIGYQSGWNTASGVANVFLGHHAGYNTSGTTNGIAIGYLTDVTASNTARIGNSSITQIGGQVGWSTLSDARFKKDVSNYETGLDLILKLNPVEYQYTAEGQEGRIYNGFLAQEVEAIVDQLGINFSGLCLPENENDQYSIRYSEFTIPLVNADQEQQEIIAEKEKEIQTLKLQMSKFEERLNHLEEQLLVKE